MKWNVGSPSSSEMKWNERFTHFSTVDVKWKLMKLFVTEMRWNEVKFMKSKKFSESRPWETTKRFIQFYQTSVLVNLSVFQTLRSFSSSQRPTYRPHRRQESRHLHECGHTYDLIWIPTMECPGNSPSCTLTERLNVQVVEGSHRHHGQISELYWLTWLDPVFVDLNTLPSPSLHVSFLSCDSKKWRDTMYELFH
jgi:hypothetical protein